MDMTGELQRVHDRVERYYLEGDFHREQGEDILKR